MRIDKLLTEDFWPIRISQNRSLPPPPAPAQLPCRTRLSPARQLDSYSEHDQSLAVVCRSSINHPARPHPSCPRTKAPSRRIAALCLAPSSPALLHKRSPPNGPNLPRHPFAPSAHACPPARACLHRDEAEAIARAPSFVPPQKEEKKIEGKFSSRHKNDARHQGKTPTRIPTRRLLTVGSQPSP